MRALVLSLLSGDNPTRNAAQASLEELTNSSFKPTLGSILDLSYDPSSSEVSIMSTILLKKKFLDNGQVKTLSPEEYQVILDKLRNNMTVKAGLPYLRRVSEALVTVLLRMGLNQEVFTEIQKVASSQDKSALMLAMYIIEISCDYSFREDVLVKHASQFEQILMKGLSHADPDVQASSFKSLTAYLMSIRSQSTIQQFGKSVLPIMLSKLIQLIKQDNLLGQQSVSNFAALIEKHPILVKAQFEQILAIFTEIIDNENFPNGLRIVTLDAIRILASAVSGQIKGSEFFTKRTLPVYVKILAQNQKTPFNDWLVDLSDSALQRTDVSSAAADNLEHLGQSLSVGFILPRCIGLVTQAIKTNKSNFQHAGLSIISILSDGSAKTFKNEMSNIFGVVYSLTQTTNPRLIYDILHCMGCLCEEFCPDLQMKHGQQICTFILQNLQSQHAKLQLASFQALTSFCSDLDEPSMEAVQLMLTQSLDSLITILSQIFEKSVINNCFELTEESITAISSIAQLFSKNFKKYYEFLMPGLRQYFMKLNSNNPKELGIKTNLIECMGYLLYSIKDQDENAFGKDCREIMEGLIDMTDRLEKDDQFRVGIFTFVEIVILCLKQKFAVFLPKIFPHVNSAVNIEVDMKIVDSLVPNSQVQVNETKYSSCPIDLGMYGGQKNFVLNHAALQTKLSAVKLFVSMAEYLGQSFQPYVPASLQTVCQMINFKNDKSVRLSMIQSIRYLVKDCGNDNQRKFFMKVVWEYLLRRINQSIKAKSLEETVQSMESLSEVCEWMKQEHINGMQMVLIATVQNINKIKDLIEKGQRQTSEDSEDEEEDADKGYKYVEKTVNKMVRLGRPQFSEVLKYFPKDYESTLGQ